MGMTPRGLRRLDDGARHEEALERRRAAVTARRDLETAVGRVNELQRELSRTRNEAALAGIAARIGAQAHELERAALELASTIEPRRYGHWSDEHFADPDAEIPDCEYRMPDCPICSRETENEAGEEIYCEVCKVRWHIDGTHGVREVDELPPRRTERMS